MRESLRAFFSNGPSVFVAAGISESDDRRRRCVFSAVSSPACGRTGIDWRYLDLSARNVADSSLWFLVELDFRGKSTAE